MRLRKENAALLMVDIQERLLPAIWEHEAVMNNALRLLKAADVLKVPFIYTEQYPKGIGSTSEPLMKAIPNGAVRFEKTAFSCCDEPGFCEKFKQLNRPLAIVFGIETHICILSTVMDLISNGSNVILAFDACGSRNERNHSAALDAARSCGALVLPTETIIYQMLMKSGTEEFKALLPMFK